MGNTGYIKLHRQIQDCWIWNEEPFSKGQAWIDLLMLANHEDHKTFFNGKLIVVERGQRLTSIKALADKWGWSRHKVSNFLDLIEKDKMIEQKRDNKKTLITIVNYSIYQGTDSDEGQQKDTRGTSKGHQKDTNKNEKNNNNTINASPERKIFDTEAAVELIPLADGSGWRPTIPEYEEYKRLFPNVDVDSEFRKMRAWCLVNSRKTRNGVKRFVTAWLSRTQNTARLSVRAETKNPFNSINRQDYDMKALEEVLENR